MAKTYLELQAKEVAKEMVDAMVETMVDKKRQLRTIDSGAQVISKQTGLYLDVSKALLKSMNGNNVTQIRGYSKEPEHLRKSKIGKSNEPRK